jgi:hypothetical protein
VAHDRPVVEHLLETIVEIDSSVRIGRAFDTAQIMDIPLAGKMFIITLIREDGEALLRGFFDFRVYGKPSGEQCHALERLIPPLAAAVRP